VEHIRFLHRSQFHHTSTLTSILTPHQSFIGTVISSALTCTNLQAFFSKGQCGNNPIEDRNALISLYTSYGLDVLTDLMVMLLPIRLIWNLQMPLSQKWGVGILFGSGIVCIFFSTLRVVQIGFEDGKPEAPKPEWQIIWTVVETSTAVTIGCAPAFAALIRSRLNTQKPSYNTQGYIRHSTSSMKLHTIGSAASRPKKQREEEEQEEEEALGTNAFAEAFWNETESSLEELAKNQGRITVTTTVHQHDGCSHSKALA
jgi:hypothetical protein